MGVAAQRAPLINGVLLDERQEQHAINVANIQLLYPASMATHCM